jgi:hypothetical protein
MELGTPNKPLSQPPKTRVCYICGRQYGLHSYDIHLKQCKDLWIARESLKDPRERKPLPEDPAERLKQSGGGAVSKKGGGGGGGSGAGGGGGDQDSGGGMTLEEINKLASEAYNTESLSTCPFCGRTFLPEKLVIHNRSCTADNPARKVTDKVKRGTPLPNLSKPEPSAERSRPSTSAGPGEIAALKRKSMKASIQQQQQDEEEGEEQEEVDSRNTESKDALVGHMGGISGRVIRKAKPIKKSSTTVPNITTREEGIDYLTEKLESLETVADTIFQTIREVKSVLAKIKELPP